jgi:hypothetical protein
MKVPCPGPGCADRRRHHDDPYTPRGPQMVESDGELMFCSLECAIYAGVIDQGGVRPREEWKIEWPQLGPSHALENAL